jgi:hypothetical protein
MRSWQEIRFRLRQELTNVKLLLRPPGYLEKLDQSLTVPFSDSSAVADRLRWTGFADEIISLAELILEHRFPIFGSTLPTGPQIHWRRDYRNQVASESVYFRLIPYLDVRRVGDHKWIWELNRHQHLVVLAQAFLFSQEQKYLDEIEREIQSWIEQNPFQRSINWASALEVAFRAMSWLWVLHLVGPSLPKGFVRQLKQGLFLHGHHLEANLSHYFSPNTHLLGEAVALHAIGTMLPEFPTAAQWMDKGASIVQEQMNTQVREDGSHFEQSTYYHVYALDMFLMHAILSEPGETYRSKLERMADFLQALLAHDRRLPFLGDDDGGRWFHPYGERDAFGNASLASCNAYFQEDRWTCRESDYLPQACWWVDCAVPSNAISENESPLLSKRFSDSGLFILRSEECKIVLDCGAFGRGSAGHSHADTLSFTVSYRQRDLLVDSGTFTYVGDPTERDRFRGTAAHNTVRVNGQDQADPVNPFRWAHPPSVQVLRWESNPSADILEAECAYRGFRHRRFIQFLKPYAILVVDSVTGPPGEHLVEQRWHLADEQDASRFQFPFLPEHISGWRSQCYGQREPAPVLCVAQHGALPMVLPAAIRLAENTEIAILIRENAIEFTVKINSENREITVSYPALLR